MKLEDILFSEEFLFEGEQADAYRARKAAEAKDRNQKEIDYKWRQMDRTRDMAKRLKDKYSDKSDDELDKITRKYEKDANRVKDNIEKYGVFASGRNFAALNKLGKRMERDIDRNYKK